MVRVLFSFVLLPSAFTAFAAASDGAAASAADHAEEAVPDTPPPPASPRAPAPTAPPTLLVEVAQAMGDREGGGEEYFRRATTGGGLGKVEVGLAPILATLPRTAEGRLEGPAVRYALHHFFVREFGWRLGGLDPMGAAWSDASPTEAAALRRLPSEVRDLVASRVDSQGLEARELAVLAWTLKYLIHDETSSRLRSAFELLRLPLDKPVKALSAEVALNIHMASHIVKRELHNISRPEMLTIYKKMPLVYPSWNETLGFIHRNFEAHRASIAGSDAFMTFEETSQVLAAITEAYGIWQNRECTGLKHMLLPFEDHSSGRLHLSDFYRSSLSGSWQFSESAGYLRQLGALDDSVPASPRVIIPNYLNSYANCVAATAYNDLCCISECEGLMSHVERSIAAPAAEPELIARTVAALPSSTVSGDRQLDVLLLKRLRTIAAQHDDGLVPIHGRLFALWMHHAYPRECPYPHAAGTTKQVSTLDVQTSSERQALFANKTEMALVAGRAERQDGPLETVPWDSREELVAEDALHHGRPIGFLFFHFFCTAGAMLALLCGVLRGAARRVRSRSSSGKAQAAVLGQIPV